MYVWANSCKPYLSSTLLKKINRTIPGGSAVSKPIEAPKSYFFSINFLEVYEMYTPSENFVSVFGMFDLSQTFCILQCNL